MIPRYSNPTIAALWTDEAKLARWNQVELAIIETRAALGLISAEVATDIRWQLMQKKVDVAQWLEREKILGHDLAAYVELRWEILPSDLRRYFHDGMTSYDTEDPAFVLALQESGNCVGDATVELVEQLLLLAERYRYQPMLERTHGQWAKLASFGSRVLMWRAELAEAHRALCEAQAVCVRSRISGAIGTYGDKLTPEIERQALEKLGLAPYYGAGQIAPRTLYLRIAHALEQMAIVLAKIAGDFELGARSGMTLWHEPFGRAQKGSSAMPHKKNPITMEQTRGLAELAQGYVSAIAESAKTNERRDIAQSCVERTAWPDLFHTLMRMLGNMRRVLGGMQVHPENMYREICESRGTYASEDAKSFLAEKLAERGVGAEIAYRIVQHACFQIFGPSKLGLVSDLAANVPKNLDEAQERFSQKGPPTEKPTGLELASLLLAGGLMPGFGRDTLGETIAGWDNLLKDIFTDKNMCEEFKELFTIPYQLKGEAVLFDHFDT